MAKYICGKNTVIETLKNNGNITELFLEKKLNFEIDKNIKVKIVSKKFLNKLVEANHQGYVAKIKEINYYGLEEIFKDNPQRILVLDHIQDPHNFGAIIRSANAAGLKHIIIPRDRQVKVTPVVFKVSSGGINGIKIITVPSLQDAIRKLKKNHYWIYSTALKNSVPISKASVNKPYAIIIGNEHKGVSKPLQKLSDQIIRIEMFGSVESLNVSVATGIILFSI